jgi:hypothetical protein
VHSAPVDWVSGRICKVDTRPPPGAAVAIVMAFSSEIAHCTTA